MHPGCFMSSLLVSSAAGLSVGENISGIVQFSGENTRVGCFRFVLGLRENLYLVIYICVSILRGD